MGTQEEIQRLKNEGVPTDTRVWVTHYFSHFDSSLSEREAFQQALRDAGFGTPGSHTEIGADEEVSGDGYWHHWAFTVLAATSDELTAADARAREIADSHGVRYTSWEVQRDPEKIGPPRPVRVTR